MKPYKIITSSTYKPKWFTNQKINKDFWDFYEICIPNSEIKLGVKVKTIRTLL